jgi:hypothetical protein
VRRQWIVAQGLLHVTVLGLLCGQGPIVLTSIGIGSSLVPVPAAGLGVIRWERA